MTAKVKNSNGFTKLQMYAERNGKQLCYSITTENTSWQTTRVMNIPVKAGKMEISFLAEGEENAFCYVDDVSLVKVR